MSLRRSAIFILFILCSFSLHAPSALAQDPPQQEPQAPSGGPAKPAARSTLPAIATDQDENQQDPNALQPDVTPLTGLEEATLGVPQFQHSYWVPGFQFASVAQRNPSYGSSSSSWSSHEHFLGNVTLVKAWSSSILALNYSGGGYVASGNDLLATKNRNYGWSSQLALSDTFHFHRWVFVVFDRFSYLPTSQFGYGAGTNLGVPGVGGSLGGGLGGLGGISIPNQSIFTTNGPIFSNAGALESTYLLSRRSSITAAGSYGILRFVDPGNVDSDMILGSLGYNYAISEKDEIGAVYRFSSFHYAGVPQAYGDHSINAAYSHKVTGRLAFRIHGGPRITTYRVPVGSNKTSTFGFNINTRLAYALRDGEITAGYTHGLSSGSGVLVGSNLDQVNVTFAHQLSRVWSGNVHAGYAHNGALSTSGQFSSPTYNSLFAGVGANRPVGRHFYMGLAYTAHVSKSSSSGCVGSSCNNTFTVHTFNLSLQWHTRPFVLE